MHINLDIFQNIQCISTKFGTKLGLSTAELPWKYHDSSYNGFWVIKVFRFFFFIIIIIILHKI